MSEQYSEENANRGELLKSARSALLWMGSSTIIVQTISWGLTFLTMRILVPEDYGLVAMITTFTPYLAMISALNLSLWMIQTKSFKTEDQEALFSLTLILGLLTAVLSFLGAPLVAAFFKREELLLPFQLVSVTFFLIGLQGVPLALLRRELRFKPIALMNVCVGISRGLIQLGLALLGFGFWSLIIGMLFHEIARTIWTIAVRGLPRKFGWNLSVYREAIRFGLAATGATIFWVMYSTLDYAVVGRFFGAELLGFYSMAFFLTDMPLSKLNQIIKPLLVPFFSRIREDRAQLDTAFFRVLRGFAGIIFPVLAGLAVVVEEAVYLVLGEQWLPLVLPLYVMCFVGLLRTFTTNIEPLLLTLGQPEKVLRFNGFSALLLPPCFYLFGKAYGIEGVYATWLFIFPITSMYALSVLEKAAGVSPLDFLKNLKAPFFAAAIMAVITFFAGEMIAPFAGPFVLLLLKIVVGVISYAGVLYLLFRKDTFEVVYAFRNVRGGPSGED